MKPSYSAPKKCLPKIRYNQQITYSDPILRFVDGVMSTARKQRYRLEEIQKIGHHTGIHTLGMVRTD